MRGASTVRGEQWAVIEESLTSRREYANPAADVVVAAVFTAPSGRKRRIEGFWDGDRRWRLRFCPDEVGQWRWQSECSDGANSGLHGREGSFECVPYQGDSALYRHGAVGLSGDRHYFAHADGTPFFWLSDTAWNGGLRATAEDWGRHVARRRQQGFTAIGFFSTHWRGGQTDSFGEKAFEEGERIKINPRFYQRLDEKVSIANLHGLLAAPIVVLALRDEDAGWALSEENLAILVRYIVARWNAYQVVWVLGGDGDFRGERSQRWKRLGRAVFGENHDRLVTMHPCGCNWSADEFRDEPWFDFVGYQSCHDDTTESLTWFVSGPPAEAWRKQPPRPIVNLEPNYEDHPAYTSRIPFTDREVRRAAYWSLLISPPAGVTYGHHHVWPWSTKPETVEGLGFYTDPLGPWTKGMDTPGTRSMTTLRRFFDSGEWWRLRPAPEVLTGQPGREDPRRFVAAATTEAGDWAVIYLPAGGEVRLRTKLLRRPAQARWFNPREGEWAEAGGVTEDVQAFAAPEGEDWMLDLRASGSGGREAP